MSVAGLSLASHAGLFAKVFAKLLNWALLWISHVLMMIQSMWSSSVVILYSISGAAESVRDNFCFCIGNYLFLLPSIDLRLEHDGIGAKQPSFGNWRVP